MSVKLRERKLAKGAIKYYLDIIYNGERTYEFLDVKIYPTDSKSVKAEKKNIANLIRSNRELDIITEDTNYIPKHLKNINFHEFAESFIEDYKKKDLRMINATYKKFKEFVENDKLKLSEVGPFIMNGFKDYLNEEAGLKGESPHNYFTRFKKILKDAELKGLIKKNPTDGIRFKRSGTSDELKKQVLTSEELQILAKAKCGNEELKKAFFFACYTGLGYAEIKKLKWKNIKKDRLETRREKTNKKIELKLKESIISILGEPKKKEDFVFDFTLKNGKTISDNGVNKCLKNWVARAKIDKHITFYCARHTMATQLLSYGANLKTVADALGHSDTRNTIKYLNYIDSLKDDAVDNLPDIDF
ncbi:site-specific integrase [Polaribacter sp. HaHaR_3_91]|uniref:site-specific integrase n=1 Tax=Polaribacter sp. HaHaR_3_91 TaxID=2745561 RepID=UPI001C4F691F|nr:site-specific integrase [Polaribacter sp. HaHaR_3_91]QXP63921.1 site-specific integrase [Polaribacter sp. HaHaR_3_91]